MKKYLSLILLFIVFFARCKKESTDIPDQDSIRLSGIDTINNVLYGTGPYYAFGFSFPQGKKISTLSVPEPDITVDNDGTLDNLILQTNNYKNSFYLAGEYGNATLAEQGFESLTAPIVSQWEIWAYSIKANQIWVYRSGTNHYAKLRIISIISETRNTWDYAECVFEWVYQPDGTLTFPGK
jgi:hypothetical protein